MLSLTMTLKVVPITDKMTKPSLQEVIDRLNSLFTNLSYRGEDKLNIILTTISFSFSQLSLLLTEEEVANLVDELLAQYIDKTQNK